MASLHPYPNFAGDKPKHIIMKEEIITTQTQEMASQEPIKTPITDNNPQSQPTTPAQEDQVAQEAQEEQEGQKNQETPKVQKAQEVQEAQEVQVSESPEAASPAACEGDAQAPEPSSEVPQSLEMLIDRIACSLDADSRLAPTEKTVAAQMLVDFVRAVAGGTLDTASLQWLRNAVNYDRDMQQAARDGEVKGRNARIEEFLKQQRQSAATHQLPASPVFPHPAIPHHIVGGLAAADRPTIWERGREKRVRH